MRPDVAVRRSSPVLLLALGFLAGVMLAVVVVPDGPSGTAVGTTGSAATGTAAGTRPGVQGDTGASGATGSATPGSPGASGTGAGSDTDETAPSATDGAGPDAVAAGAGERDVEPGPQRGVDGDTIRIGIGLPDIGAIAALGPGYDQGNLRDHVESVIAGWRRDGLLPVAGREVELVYRSFNILSQEEQRATCVGFGQDDEVFAVVAIHNYTLGAECVSAEYRIPILTANGPFDPAYRRGAPFLFTTEMSASRVLRNFVAWGDQAGHFDGRKIGVYYSNDPSVAPEVQALVVDRLAELGHDVVAEVTTDQQSAATGGPNDSVAVQRFRAAGVDLAILLVSPVAKTNFFTQAQTQGYRPTYLENDMAFATTSTGTSTYPADYFDGTLGVTGQRFGEAAAGIPETPESQSCGADFTAHTGRTVDREAREAEYIAGNQVCDELRLAMTALQWAGRNLTPERFVAGLETVQAVRMGIHGDVTFGPDRHDGVGTFRELRWSKGCRCWVAQGDLRPLAAR